MTVGEGCRRGFTQAQSSNNLNDPQEKDVVGLYTLKAGRLGTKDLKQKRGTYCTSNSEVTVTSCEQTKTSEVQPSPHGIRT